MRVLIIGGNGQLGADLVKVLSEEEPYAEVIPLTHQEVEVCDFEGTFDALKAWRPDVVINTAAYHKVDECERNVERALEVNAYGVRNVALACREVGCSLVHLSTDYVFDGRKGEPYVEVDVPCPANAYGVSKLAGEHFVRYILDRHLIIRTSGLYGVAGASGKGGNFVELMLRLAREGSQIRVVNDQVLSPTYTWDLARRILELLQKGASGTFHVTSSGACSWYDFAVEIFRLAGLQPNLTPTTSREFGAPAPRPGYSVLASTRLEKMGLAPLRPWKEALAAYLREKGHLAQ